MRGREVFLETLLAHGVDRIFGNPGTTESPLLDSLAAYPSIKYVTALHESVALCAASYYAQASGKTGVVSLPHGWGHDKAGTQLSIANEHPGVNTNELSPGTFVAVPSGNAPSSNIWTEVSGWLKVLTRTSPSGDGDG